MAVENGITAERGYTNFKQPIPSAKFVHPPFDPANMHYRLRTLLAVSDAQRDFG